VRDAIAGVISLRPRETKPPLIKKLDTDASPVSAWCCRNEDTARAV